MGTALLGVSKNQDDIFLVPSYYRAIPLLHEYSPPLYEKLFRSREVHPSSMY